MRQGRRNARFRERSLAHFEAIVRAAEEGREYPALDRVFFALGSQYNEDPQRRERSHPRVPPGIGDQSAFRGWPQQFGPALAARRSGVGGDGGIQGRHPARPQAQSAVREFGSLVFSPRKTPELEQEYQHICEEFAQSAPQVLARLSLEMVELGKEQVYEGFYTKGHRIKNLMGIIGSRLRGLGRKAEGTQQGELNRLGGEYEALYDEWVGFLEAMKTDKIHPAVIDLGRLVRRVARRIWPTNLEIRDSDAGPRRLAARGGR